jgi:uncharacterized delta-60 repeat protein
VGTDLQSASGIAVQADGRILVSGTSERTDGDTDFVVVCFKPDGSLDTGFGSSGKIKLNIGSLSFDKVDIAVQADGRVVIAGSAGYPDALLVYRIFGTTNEVTGTTGNDSLIGAGGMDTLKGAAGADVLKGGTAADRLIGGPGADKLTGGSGPDKFVFDANLGAGVDTIKDFKSADADTIILDNDIFTILGAPKTLGSGNFATGSAHDGDDYIIYNASSGALFYDADGNGGGVAIQFATVGTTTHPTLHSTDFVIVS